GAEGAKRMRAWRGSCWSKSPHQRGGGGRKQLLGRHRFGDDAWRQRVPDELIDDVAVRRDAVGERLAGDLHAPPVHLVDLARLLDLASLEPLDIVALGAGKGIEDVGGEMAMLGEQLVLYHHQIVD